MSRTEEFRAFDDAVKLGYCPKNSILRSISNLCSEICFNRVHTKCETQLLHTLIDEYDWLSHLWFDSMNKIDYVSV